jgi:hypothetical protein
LLRHLGQRLFIAIDQNGNATVTHNFKGRRSANARGSACDQNNKALERCPWYFVCHRLNPEGEKLTAAL